jgi:hypothetical protein
MRKLMSVELLKIRRSLALLMLVAAPLIVVVFDVLMMLKRTGLAALASKHWAGFWMGNTALWTYFMLPLYIALVCALLNGQEHRNQSWRLMLTLPVSQSQLYVVKALLAWLFVVCSNLVLLGATALAIALLGAAGAPLAGAFEYPIVSVAARMSVACLPIILIQHAVAWRFQNLVLPLAVGVFGTMGIMQVGSSEYWTWYPWTYPLMAANGSDGGNQHLALMLAAGLGALLFAVTTLVLGRREVAA